MAKSGYNASAVAQSRAGYAPTEYDKMMGSVVPTMPSERIAGQIPLPYDEQQAVPVTEGQMAEYEQAVPPNGWAPVSYGPEGPPAPVAQQAEVPIQAGSNVVPIMPMEQQVVANPNNTNNVVLPTDKMTGRRGLDNIETTAQPFQPTAFDPDEVVRDPKTGLELSVEAKKALWDKEQKFQQERVANSSMDLTATTREEVNASINNNRMNGPKELGAVFTLGENLANALLAFTGFFSTPDNAPDIFKGKDVTQILAHQFNTTALKVVNAATESATKVLAAIGQAKLRGAIRQEVIEGDFDVDAFFSESGESESLINDADGTMGVEVEAMHRWLAASTDSIIRGSDQTPSQSQGVGKAGYILAQGLESAGYIMRDDYQPLDVNTGEPKGPRIKAYLLTAKGKAAGSSLMNYTTHKGMRGGASAMSGNTTEHIGASQLVAGKGDSSRAGRDQPGNKGVKVMRKLGRMISNAIKRVDTNMVALSSTMLAGLNTTPSGDANSFLNRFHAMAQDILNIDQKTVMEAEEFGGKGVERNIPINESAKAKKARNDISNISQLHARTPLHKTPSFVDPSSWRNYGTVFDSNGQESITHRNVVVGIAQSVNIKGMMPAKLSDGSELVTKSQMDAYNKWIKGDYPASPTVTYVAHMIALGNSLVRGSRDYSNQHTLNQMNGNTLLEHARIGRSIQKFIDINGEVQATLIKSPEEQGNPAVEINMEGLTATEQGDILSVMEKIISTGSEKEYGAIFRGYIVAAQYADAHASGKSSMFVSLPTAADMKSAGRLFSAVDIMDDDTVSRVGIAMNAVADGAPEHSAFPLGNPRLFYTQTLIEALRSPDNGPSGFPRGNADFTEFTAQQSAEVATLLSAMMDKQGPTFADMTAKLILMVADYGKAASQNTFEVSVFLRKAEKNDPQLFAELQNIFEGQPEGAINQFFEEAMWSATTQIVNSKNSGTIKRMAEAMALLNVQPYYIGIGGMRVRIGRGIQEVMPGYTFTLQTLHGLEVTNLQTQYNVDDPLQKSPARMLEDGRTWYTPGVASAAVNATAPAIGHSRESAAMALALSMVVDRLGEGIFIDQVYDSVTLEPEAAALYNHYLNEIALFEVLAVNDAHQLSLAFWETMKTEINGKPADKATGEPAIKGILHRDTVTVGPSGEFSGWTTKLDEEWAALTTPHDKKLIKSQKFLNNIKSAEGNLIRKLHAAQEAGLWNPPGDRDITHTAYSNKKGVPDKTYTFTPRTPNLDIWLVDGRKFGTWLSLHVVKDLKKKGEELWSPSDSKRRIEFIKRMMAVQNKAFQSQGLDF